MTRRQMSRRVAVPGMVAAALLVGATPAFAQTEDANADVFAGDAGAAQREAPEGDGAVTPLDFAPDRSKVLLHRFLSASESNLFTLELDTGAFARVTPEIAASYGGGEFTPDGRSVITISDEGSQFRRLVRIDHFIVTLARDDGGIQSFRRVGDSPKVEIHDPLAGHKALWSVLTEKDIHDTTAYLVTLK